MSNYIGKTVFVGIDVHKNSYTAVAVLDGDIIKKTSMEAKPENLTSYLSSNFKGANIRTAYEAGFSGFHLHRYLLDKGIANIVVHPASIEISARDRVKTDKRDAAKIAIQLATNRLHSIYIPSEQQENNRAITRLRNNLVEHQKIIARQLKSLLHLYGAIPPFDKRKVSKKWITWALSLDLAEGVKCFVKNLSDIWLYLRRIILDVEERIKQQVATHPNLYNLYKSVPGFGPLISSVLINEVGDLKQFATEKKLFSYMGLTPCEYSSGDKIRRGHISRQGKPIFRKLLIQAAWIAIKVDKELSRKYNNLGKRTGKKKAIVAIARILIGRARACVINGKYYYIGE